ncbi:hypothetical protein N7468_006522 [Penicillium chermesinum]|uniref:Uncharacterized protein n=1 Tax=Penicillium chermesinum TaxID=63820 RepID=A0A9W9NSE1_9EURO|nr:uncharacterized protein N7468_006522 [Penicillium chermesinum]KAJ5225297.1 hypothetical protein N7468_006522 [Penicillium chermesinum]
MSTPPVVPEMTKVFFSFKVPGNSLEAFRQTSFVGTVVEDDSICDFTIACRGAVPKRLLDFSPFVFLSLEGVTSPLEKQTVALEKTAQPLVEGDLAERFKVGFSLLRTVLSHGVEMNPESPLCFELSIKDLSPLPPKEASSRLQMVQKFFEDKLDKSQRKAVRLSVERLRGGLSIIVGPPGTGKTLTAIPVIVSAMALEVPVLLTAATNKAVGNVLAALMNFLQRYPCIGSLCGLAMRLRAVDEELATLRGHGTAERPVDATIQQAEAYNLVVKYATMEKDRSSDCRRLIELLDMDLKFGVSGPPLSELKRLYKSTLGRVIGKARLIAATLIESGAEILKTSKFKPALMICDEASQASEPEMMIPMTLKSFRGLVLIGDPNQLEPTVLSINGKNEHALFLKRSLLKRLVDAKYPLAQLQTDYRNHPQIMEFFNRRVYLNTLNVGAHKSIPLNNERARVGQVFDSFMESYVARAEHCHIPKSEVARLKRTVPGRRRLWLKIQSYAKREISGQSWENKPQVTALKTFLLQLYRYQYKGMSITPDDVMVLCPYRAQQEICRLELQLDANLAGEIIPVDAAQGREAPMTILMLTTPGRGGL